MTNFFTGLPKEHSLNKIKGGKALIAESKARGLIDQAIEEFIATSEAGQKFAEFMDSKRQDVIVDHITVRTHNVVASNRFFEAMGYVTDPKERLDYRDAGWWAQVLRKPGFPVAFVDQTYDDEKDPDKQIVRKWVDVFGDPVKEWGDLFKKDRAKALSDETLQSTVDLISLHHIAVRVPDIEKAISSLRTHGVDFGDNTVTAEEEEINGKPTKLLLQIFTKAQSAEFDGQAHPFSVLEIIERRMDPRTGEIYPYFRRRQADELMKSTKGSY